MTYARIVAAASLMLLSACSGNSVKTTLGLDRAPPDEFRVVSRPPLSVPPQFTLQPPSASALPPGQLPASQQAESLVTGAKDNNATSLPLTDTAVIPVKSGPPQSGAEEAFLQQAGAHKADPNVREKLVEERITAQDAQAEKSWWDFSSDPPPKEPIVNAKAESQRIKNDKDSGKPVTDGETPVVKQKDTGVLGQIFGY